MPTEDRFDKSYRPLARKLLARAPGFDACPAATLDALMDQGQLVRLARAEVLLRRGELCEHLSMVVEGALEASLVLNDGRRHLLTLMEPGTFMGFLAFVDRGPQPHDVVAHAPTILLKIPADAVSTLRAMNLPLCKAFEMQLALRTRRLYDALTESLLFPLRERLAKQLLELVDGMGIPRDGRWTIDLQLPQADLADLIGAGRQAVNTELRKLQAEGVIRTTRNHIEVIDLDGLRQRAPQGMPAAGCKKPDDQAATPE